ncbi:MAG: hypothetical protein ACRCWB_11460, partial [Enterovibrio sp.]
FESEFSADFKKIVETVNASSLEDAVKKLGCNVDSACEDWITCRKKGKVYLITNEKNPANAGFDSRTGDPNDDNNMQAGKSTKTFTEESKNKMEQLSLELMYH